MSAMALIDCLLMCILFEYYFLAIDYIQSLCRIVYAAALKVVFLL